MAHNLLKKNFFTIFLFYFLTINLVYLELFSAEIIEKKLEKQSEEKNEPRQSHNVKQFAEKYGLQGDWVTKKMYLIKSAEIKALMNEKNEKVIEIRSTVYAPKINEISDALKAFKIAPGTNKGGISASIFQLQNRVDKNLNSLLEIAAKPEKDNYPQDVIFKIYEAEDKYISIKDSLAKLKMDIDFVDDLQKSFESRIEELDKNVAKASEFIEEADSKIEEMTFVLDHEKAKNIAAHIEALATNVNLIFHYVETGALSQFDEEQKVLSKEVEKFRSEISKIKKDIDEIEQAIILTEKSILPKAESVALEKVEDYSQNPDPEKIIPKSLRPEKKSFSLFDWIIRLILLPIKAIVSFFK